LTAKLLGTSAEKTKVWLAGECWEHEESLKKVSKKYKYGVLNQNGLDMDVVSAE
jgi:hypothetical protein